MRKLICATTVFVALCGVLWGLYLLPDIKVSPKWLCPLHPVSQMNALFIRLGKVELWWACLQWFFEIVTIVGLFGWSNAICNALRKKFARRSTSKSSTMAVAE